MTARVSGNAGDSVRADDREGPAEQRGGRQERGRDGAREGRGAPQPAMIMGSTKAFSVRKNSASPRAAPPAVESLIPGAPRGWETRLPAAHRERTLPSVRGDVKRVRHRATGRR